MPAAAVIPAPIAYIKVVAVKKLVVGFLTWSCRPGTFGCCVVDISCHLFGCLIMLFTGCSNGTDLLL